MAIIGSTFPQMFCQVCWRVLMLLLRSMEHFLIERSVCKIINCEAIAKITLLSLWKSVQNIWLKREVKTLEW